ncbi:MAG: response regulator [Parvibaculum sp.]
MKTALVADPSPASRRAASHLLERLGFRVAGASGSEETLAMIAGTVPDLILIDGRLEAPQGGLLIEAVRRLPGGQDFCLFHVTADGAPSSVRRAMEAGADDYLAKPFDEALLSFKLAQARTRGRLDGRRPQLRLVQDNSAAGATAWRFRLFGRAV